MMRSSVVGSWSDRPIPHGGLASARSPVSASGADGLGAALGALEHELAARGDPQLGERLAQVVVDRAGAEEEPRGNLLVRRALADEPGDLQLLRRELVERARTAPTGGLTAR